MYISPKKLVDLGKVRHDDVVGIVVFKEGDGNRAMRIGPCLKGAMLDGVDNFLDGLVSGHVLDVLDENWNPPLGTFCRRLNDVSRELSQSVSERTKQ